MTISNEEAMKLAEKHVGALDVLLEDRVPLDKAVAHIVASLNLGYDPMEQAEHFVKLRKAFRGEV